jgi:hypothetical protein
MVFQHPREFLAERLARAKANTNVTSEQDAQRIREITVSFQQRYTKHRTLSRIRIVVFILIYASVLSSFALPVLAEVADVVTIITNVIGVGVFTLVALYLTWRLGHLWNQLSVLGSELFAIYEKHQNQVGLAQTLVNKARVPSKASVFLERKKVRAQKKKR